MSSGAWRSDRVDPRVDSLRCLLLEERALDLDLLEELESNVFAPSLPEDLAESTESDRW